MRVIKRNGSFEIVSFDKILNRVKNVGKTFNLKIPYTQLVMKVIDQLYDNIETTKIDDFTIPKMSTSPVTTTMTPEEVTDIDDMASLDSEISSISFWPEGLGSKFNFGPPPEFSSFQTKYDVDQELSPNKCEENISRVHGKGKFKCSICFKVLVAKSTLKRHISLVHEKNKPFQCISCPTRFAFKNDLERHFAEAHEGEEIDCQDTNDVNDLNGHQDNSEIILPD